MVTLSSTDAEYIVACGTVKEAAWLTQLYMPGSGIEYVKVSMRI